MSSWGRFIEGDKSSTLTGIGWYVWVQCGLALHRMHFSVLVRFQVSLDKLFIDFWIWFSQGWPFNKEHKIYTCIVCGGWSLRIEVLGEHLKMHWPVDNVWVCQDTCKGLFRSFVVSLVFMLAWNASTLRLPTWFPGSLFQLARGDLGNEVLRL